MDRLRRLLFITFIESFATVLVERGLYFFTFNRMGFSDSANLALALGYGIAYMSGALASHKVSVKVGEKRLMFLLVALHLLFHGSLAFTTDWVWLFVAINLLLAFVTGAKWPILESYISAGKSPKATAGAIGKFNISWALAVPLAMGAAGPLIGWMKPALFVIPAIINLFTLWLLRPLESRPLHLPHDHPERLPAATLARFRSLMISSRWSMVASYTLLFLVVPLVPGIFKRLGAPEVVAPALAALVEVFRFATFVLLQRRDGWHGRIDVLIWSAVGLPLGFLMMRFGGEIPGLSPPAMFALVLSGELIFGVGAGLAYYAALYYAMVISNASVESGGAHESLIGGGFAFGPAIGLAGVGLGALGVTGGPLIAVAPVILLCLGGGLLPLRRSGSSPFLGRG